MTVHQPERGTRERQQRWRAPSDELVLAAVDRAHRHTYVPENDASTAEIATHLGIAWGPVTARRLRPILARLAGERGWLSHSHKHRRDCWKLTSKGACALAGAVAAGVREQLPESPQHRQWRAARDHAAARIQVLQSELGELAGKLTDLLDRDSPPPACELVALARPLRDLTVAVAMAHYCLYERVEPDDARAERDEPIGPAGSPWSWRYPRLWDPGHGD
jgi:hypothetical protein